MARTRDMTVGSPTRLLFSFALPIMLGNMFQQLYSIVDTLVVGRYVGVEALAAVGAASWLDWLALGIVMGFAQGFSIMAAQCFGAGDYQRLRKVVALSAYLTLGVVVLMTVAAHLALVPMLRLMRSPQETIGLTGQYLRVVFSGMFAMGAINLFSGILRALGDSRTPLIAMVAAAVTNIVLDLVFVIAFGWGVAGVAVATVMAQSLSALICLNSILHIPVLRLQKKDWAFDAQESRRLMKLGLPIAFQNMIIAVGGLVLQSIVNTYGYIFMAGFNAANRLVGLMELAGTSLGSAVATFTGQNLGAGKPARIREGVRKAALLAILLALAVGLVIILTGRFIIGQFVSGEPEIVQEVIQAAYPYLITMSAMLFVLYLLYIYRSALQGIGDTIIPMWSGAVELAMRIGCVLLFNMLIGRWGIYIAEVSAWLGAMVLLVWGYHHRMRRIQARYAQEE